MRAHLQAALAKRRAASLYRRRRVHHAAQQPLLRLDGQDLLNFCSNDYLGLAAHPELRAALQQGATDYGCGAGASHLINGHSQAHHDLEEALAAYTGRERALLFSTGYMANLGVISALLERQDALFLDKWDHASLLDGAQLSRARLHRYPHQDMQQLARQLENHSARHKLIVTDGVFSMDGDIANLPALADLARAHEAWLLVDDAHGLGVLGATGRGSLEHYALDAEAVPVLVGTLGKAFGVFGAFVAGDADLIEYLIQTARSYIYTTALPPAVAVATRRALQLADTESWRRDTLRALIRQFRDGAAARGIPLMPSDTPIQGIILGDAEAALRLDAALFAAKLWVSAIRPPTVPQGSARLRITLTAAHTPEQVEYLLDTLAALLSLKKGGNGR